MIALSILATLVSSSLLMLLGWRDPKRLRTSSKQAPNTLPAFSPGVRRVLTLGALLPGFALALFGAWQPFLVWLGATCTLVWLAVQALSAAGSAAGDRA